ncbi:MAG: sensor domain-containing diguanylate cyclase [Natronospirillum sp.]|uniref:sensor domain-containing diguanylate cyclase n=1 Tax=Natronospirillum sp. TaxID=2812955 RepID=UPI0025F48A5C|nr:sensor domain-containing diguanylate cyclase [Natronospirillum sp.]MCH8550740.1 sensor domain-containing diguanylate cyclase [Natronospirillum sp.]
MQDRRQQPRTSLASGSDADLFVSVSHAARKLCQHTHWREGISDFLSALGAHTGASRVWIFRTLEYGPDYYVTRYISEWAARPDLSNIDDPVLHSQRVEVADDFSRQVYEARLRGELLAHQVDDLPGRFGKELRRQGVRSMLTVPIMLKQEWWGILGFDFCDYPRAFPESYRAALEIASLLLTNAVMQERLHWQANHDPLTGLYNRRYLMETVDSDLTDGTAGALIILDLDWFKAVNDHHGHQAGDQALVRVADVLQRKVPRQSVSARLGGEEFAIWVTAENIPADELAERIRASIEAVTLEFSSGVAALTISVGVASSGPDDVEDSFSALFARADRALFIAKEAGRNQVVCAD